VYTLKEEKHIIVKHIVIGAFTLIIVILIVYSTISVRRSNVIRQELTAAQEALHEMQFTHDMQRLDILGLLKEIEELQAGEPIDPVHYRAMQYILDVTPERLRCVFDEDVELNASEDFVMLPNNRILISGEWVCPHFETTYTLEAIFRFWVQDDEISLSLLSYSPFGWADWRDPWESPNRHSWVRHHALETVPIRFYEMGANWGDFWYNVEYLNGETFSDELAYQALQHLNRIIIDAWFVGRILYVNLHRSEPIRMSSGTFGEFAMYSTLVSSMASVPGIDALVILVDGQRESWYGGHGASFKDIYLINDMGSSLLR